MKECPVAKKFKIKKVNECPNYIEGWWTPEGKDKPKIVHDCVNKRILLMIQDLYGRLIGVQKSQEHMRNKYEQNQTTMNLLSENIRLNFERVLNQRIGRLGRVLEIENIGEGEKLDEAV
jgi:hypothetical protein